MCWPEVRSRSLRGYGEVQQAWAVGDWDGYLPHEGLQQPVEQGHMTGGTEALRPREPRPQKLTASAAALTR